MDEPGLLWGGLAMLVLSPFLAALMVFLGLRYSRTSRAVKGWPVARGTVLASEVAAVTMRGDTSYGPRITYQYEVGGQTYRSNNLNLFDLLGGSSRGSKQGAMSKASRYVVGHPVEVRYDPARPGRAILDTTTPAGMIWFMYGMAVFCLVTCGGGGAVLIIASLL